MILEKVEFKKYANFRKNDDMSLKWNNADFYRKEEVGV